MTIIIPPRVSIFSGFCDPGFEDELELPVVFHDVPVLSLQSERALSDALGRYRIYASTSDFPSCTSSVKRLSRGAASTSGIRCRQGRDSGPELRILLRRMDEYLCRNNPAAI